MALFLDVHEPDGPVDEHEVMRAHMRDVAVQAEYGVRFLRYWFDRDAGKVFCLSEANDAEAPRAAHAAAGNPPRVVYAVEQGI